MRRIRLVNIADAGIAAAALCAVASALIGMAAPASASVPGPLGMGGNWRLTHSETPAQLSHWGLDPAFGVGPLNGDEKECYSPANVTLGVYLRLAFTARPCVNRLGQAEQYTGAFIESPWTQKYGAYEAKMLLPTQAGGGIANWPCFWLVIPAGPFPATGSYGEIDVTEGIGGMDWMSFHYGPVTQPQHTDSFRYVESPGWHVYGVRWNPYKITWYVDGHQIYQQPDKPTPGPMHVIFDSKYGYCNSVSDPCPVTPDVSVRIAWLRTWLG